MRSKQSRTFLSTFYVHTSLQDLMRAMAVVVILLSAPAQAADLKIEPPVSPGYGQIPSDVQGQDSLQEDNPALTRNYSRLLAARGSFSDSSRPAGQLRVGGAGGGYHGPSHPNLPFEPEVPGQSIQQSIGQTLDQPPKPTPDKSPDQYKQKQTHKPVAKTSQSSAEKSASKPAKKNEDPSQKEPTVYIIKMNDGQVYKGTIKPAGKSYIISTKNGPLTIRKKNIVSLTKATL